VKKSVERPSGCPKKLRLRELASLAASRDVLIRMDSFVQMAELRERPRAFSQIVRKAVKGRKEAQKPQSD
jgi:hypothetical protein